MSRWRGPVRGMPSWRVNVALKGLLLRAQRAVLIVVARVRSIAKSGRMKSVQGNAAPAVDPRLAEADPAIAAYVAAREPEWFSLEATAPTHDPGWITPRISSPSMDAGTPTPPPPPPADMTPRAMPKFTIVSGAGAGSEAEVGAIPEAPGPAANRNILDRSRSEQSMSPTQAGSVVPRVRPPTDAVNTPRVRRTEPTVTSRFSSRSLANIRFPPSVAADSGAMNHRQDSSLPVVSATPTTRPSLSEQFALNQTPSRPRESFRSSDKNPPATQRFSVSNSDRAPFQPQWVAAPPENRPTRKPRTPTTHDGLSRRQIASGELPRSPWPSLPSPVSRSRSAVAQVSAQYWFSAQPDDLLTREQRST